MTDKKYPVEKSPEEWREQLTPDEYQVLRNSGTERPFTGEYWDFKGEGEYHCRACGILLFESNTKFDSGCGWPSFFAAHKQAVEYKEDFAHGMHRVEVLCKSCGSHLGHVFQDAPHTPSGQRYCINSVCLNFTPKGENEKL